MNQILNAVKAFLTPEFLEETSLKYEESELGIAKAISSLTPAILLGLGEKAGDSHAIYPIFNAMRDFDDNRSAQTEAQSNEAANQFLATLFGAKTPAISNAIASFSGVKPTTAASLLPISASWVMGLLSQKIRSEHLTAGTLVSYLLSEKNALLSLIPANVGGLLGMSEISERHFARPERSGLGQGWWWILLILLLAGVVVWLGIKG